MQKMTVRLDFPLERVPEPVFSRLVTEFDVSPNLLSAEINSATGGWLVLGLEGEDATIARALDWTRAQGVTVTALGKS